MGEWEGQLEQGKGAIGGEHNGFEINQCVMTLLMGHNLTENQNVFLYLRREVFVKCNFSCSHQ